MTLPSIINYGTVAGLFLRGVTDAQGREARGVPIAGATFVFTPSVQPAIVRVQGAVPPVTILLEPILASTNASGVLVGPDGTPGVRLVASMDVDLEPRNWTWGVIMDAPGYPRLTFSFPVQVNASIDLTTVVPVPPDLGAATATWQAAVEATLANKAGAQMAEAYAVQARLGAEAARDAAVTAGNLITTGIGAFVVLTPGQPRPAALQPRALILRVGA